MPTLRFFNHRIRSALRELGDHDAERMKTLREKSMNVSISKGGNKKVVARMSCWLPIFAPHHAALCKGSVWCRTFESSPKARDVIIVTPFQNPPLKICYVENGVQADRISEASVRTKYIL